MTEQEAKNIRDQRSRDPEAARREAYALMGVPVVEGAYIESEMERSLDAALLGLLHGVETVDPVIEEERVECR